MFSEIGSDGQVQRARTSLRAQAAVIVSSDPIASVDSVAGSFVRTQHPAKGAEFDYPETPFANNPHSGFGYRRVATSTAAKGTSASVHEFSCSACVAWA